MVSKSMVTKRDIYDKLRGLGNDMKKAHEEMLGIAEKGKELLAPKCPDCDCKISFDLNVTNDEIDSYCPNSKCKECPWNS